MQHSRICGTLLLYLSLCTMLAAQNGDWNQDGAYNCSDVNALVEQIVTESNNLEYDLDGDGQLLQSDVTRWLEIAGEQNLGAPYIYGDGDLSGNVDRSDLTGIWNTNKFRPTARGWCDGDMNASGTTDVTDALILFSNIYQQSSVELGTGNGPHPIPSSMTRFVYDPTDGQMFISMPSDMHGWVIPGPQALETIGFDGFDGQNALTWYQSYFAESQQWVSLTLGLNQGVTGTYLLANYPEGLGESDFGIVTYGAERTTNDFSGFLSTEVEFITILPGDANLDGVVDVADFNAWNANKFGDFEANWGHGDFNHDGRVDVGDFNIWNANKFQSGNDSTSVPEPSGRFALVLALAFLSGNFVNRCRKQTP